MKVLIAGATGFIGSEVLTQAIANSYFSHIYVLTRRPLDQRYNNKKVIQILHEDFEVYPELLLNRLRDEGLEACIWALGGKLDRFKTIEEARKVGISFPIQGAEALAKHVAPALKPYLGFPKTNGPAVGKAMFPFRFVYISGWGAEQDQFRSLWIFSDTRKINGAAEKGIFEAAGNSLEVEGHKCFEAIALRPGTVLPTSDSIATVITEAVVPSVTVNRLANCAIHAVIHGTDGRRVLENKDCLGEGWAMVNSTKALR